MPSRRRSRVSGQSDKGQRGSRVQSSSKRSSGRQAPGVRRPQMSRRRPSVAAKSRSAEGQDCESEEWYHGLLPRADCEEMLKNQGEFLVHRENISSDKLSIAVKWDNQVTHISIKQLGFNEYTIDEGKKKYPSVTELVNHYMQSSETLNSKDMMLLNPVPRQSWEIRHDQVLFDKKLGEGAFGEVYKGILLVEKKKVDVAIKRSHNSAQITQKDVEDMMKEARVMSKFDNANIIHFYGVACERVPMMIVMEFVNGGSLDTYLRKNKDKLDKRQFYVFCMGSCKGIEYLHSVGCIHRDIAARNCLLELHSPGDTYPDVKISDFGMTKDQGHYRQENAKKMPIKWLAIESLTARQFSAKTDVWAYGILMWEIYARGSEPYPGKTSAEVTMALKTGYRMSAPDGMPECMASIMKSCWLENDASRPTFPEINSRMTACKKEATY